MVERNKNEINALHNDILQDSINDRRTIMKTYDTQIVSTEMEFFLGNFVG